MNLTSSYPSTNIETKEDGTYASGSTVTRDGIGVLFTYTTASGIAGLYPKYLTIRVDWENDGKIDAAEHVTLDRYSLFFAKVAMDKVFSSAEAESMLTTYFCDDLKRFRASKRESHTR